jgi:hypothetical protein
MSAVALLAASALFGADQSLLTLVNPEAKVVGGMNVARTMSSPLGQFLLSRMDTQEPGFKEFANLTGFDPRRDVREVVFSSTGNPGAKNGVLIARGVFNGPQLLATARAKAKAVSQFHKGVELVGHDGGALAVIEGSLLIIGDEANVKGAIDRRTGSAIPDTAVFRKATSLMDRYDAWMSSNAPVPTAATTPHPGAPVQVPVQALQGILETSGGVKFDSVIAFEGEAVTRSEKDAQALMDMVRFMTSLLQMNGQQNPQVKQIEAVLNSLEMRAEASTVRFSLRVPEADLEQWINTAAKAPRRRAALK